jgi:hypothetical protein
MIEYQLGRNLSSLAEPLKLFYSRVVDLGQRVMALLLQPVVAKHPKPICQFPTMIGVRSLILTGEVMHETEYMQASPRW